MTLRQYAFVSVAYKPHPQKIKEWPWLPLYTITFPEDCLKFVPRAVASSCPLLEFLIGHCWCNVPHNKPIKSFFSPVQIGSVVEVWTPLIFIPPKSSWIFTELTGWEDFSLSGVMALWQLFPSQTCTFILSYRTSSFLPLRKVTF